MGLAGAPWFAIPLATITAVKVVTMIVNFSNHRKLLQRAASRATHDAESVINAVARLADNPKDDAYPSTETASATVIDLNTKRRRIVVSQTRLRSVRYSLLALFDCYAVACRCGTVPDVVKADLWNCLCAIVEAHIMAYLSASVLSANPSEAAAALAVCKMLLGRRYHVTHFLKTSPTSPRLLLGSPPRHLLAQAVRKNGHEGSRVRSLALFARFLHTTCTRSETLLFALLTVIHVMYLSWSVQTTSFAAVPSAFRYIVEVLNEVTGPSSTHVCTWKRFVWRVVSSSPGRLLASAALSVVASHLFHSAKEAASNAVLQHLHITLKTNTLLALTRFDFVADAHWFLPGRVYGALDVVTSFSFGDVGRLLDVVGERVQWWRTVWRFPVACAIGWLTRQGIDWLQRCWTRACLMTAFVACYAANETGCCTDPRGRVGTAKCWLSSLPYGTHYGLQALLLAAVSPADMKSSPSAMAQWLAEHTRLPVAPHPCLLASERVLEALSAADRDAGILRARYNAVRELCASPDEEAQTPSPFTATLSLRRASGDGVWGPPSWLPNLAVDSVTLDADILEEVMDKALSSCAGVPIMAAVAVTEVQSRAQRCTRSPVSEDAVAAIFDVTRVMDSGAVFVMPPTRPWALVSSFQFDVQEAQLHYYEHESYSRSVETLVYVQHTHRPTLDGHPWEYYSAPPALLVPCTGSSSAWRVTFDHVSFRYPGTDRDVLNDITFDVAAGGFLGIIGYSGAGKSTLLLLLSRVYAPTRGQIRINGHPIECIPPRALRRRLGNCWQFDREACFLEGLSVGRNVAYGCLAAASVGAITAAIEQACVDTAVAARPNGLREPLRCSEWSDGEVARLMLARALMVPSHDAGVYIFDECTSCLDSLTEAKVFSSDLCRLRSATRVMVSHRLASVHMADEIIVLAHGRIVERGTWNQLLGGGHNSLFYTLYRAQAVS